MYDSANPYLTGNYAPWREEGDAFDLEIEGELPRDLNGALYRIGPNPHFKPLGRYHWFDGDGMVHAFLLRDGRAAYRNRYVRTDGLKAEMKQGRALFGGLLEQPREMTPELPPFKNAANTNIIGYANRLLALFEAASPHELKPDTLETVGLFNFGGKLTGPVTAHPKFDPATGDLLFFGYQPFPPYVTWYRATRDGKLVESRPIDTGLPVMMHDFIATDNYAIFFVCPSVFHLENAPAGKPIFNLGAAARHKDRCDESQDRRRAMVPGRGVLHLPLPECVRGERLAGGRRMQDGVARHVRQFVRRQARDAVAMESEFEGRLDAPAASRRRPI